MKPLLILVLGLLMGTPHSSGALDLLAMFRNKQIPCDHLLAGTRTKYFEEAIVYRLAQVETYWQGVFERRGLPFQELTYAFCDGDIVVSDFMPGETKIVNCREIGLFYHRTEKKVYINPQFFVLRQRNFGVPTDALILGAMAHEYGHHIQTMLNAIQKASPVYVAKHAGNSTLAAKDLLEGLERQADCLAGVVFGHFRRMGFAAPDQSLDAAVRFGMMGRDIQMFIERPLETILYMLLTNQLPPTDDYHPDGLDRVTWFQHGLDTTYDLAACEPLAIPVLNKFY